MKINQSMLLTFGAMAAWAVCTSALRAEVRLPAIISDHMVLQAEARNRIWGWASPGESVEVSFLGVSEKTQADPQGQWVVEITPLKASAEGATLAVAGRNRIEVKDVLVGEVWLGSGQSNMELTLGTMRSAEQDKAQSDLPLIRHFGVVRSVASRPQSDCDGEWKVCSPKTASGFSAVLLYFGRDLHKARKVPVGLINASMGGSHIHAWWPKEVQSVHPAFVKPLYEVAVDGVEYTDKDQYLALRNAHIATNENKKTATSAFPWYSAIASGTYNAMLAPINNYKCRGAIWYQGEADAGDPLYADKLEALATSWRQLRQDPDLPFYYVQLPNVSTNRSAQPTDHPWARMREIQRQAQRIPNSGMVVTIDGEDSNGHPKVKRYIGERLALLARHHCYGEKDLEWSGPQLVSVTRADGCLTLTFSSKSGLKLKEGEPNGFAVSADGKSYFWADAKVEGNQVRLTCREVPSPAYVRYAWDANPYISLFNGAGLPASTFAAECRFPEGQR